MFAFQRPVVRVSEVAGIERERHLTEEAVPEGAESQCLCSGKRQYVRGRRPKAAGEAAQKKEGIS